MAVILSRPQCVNMYCALAQRSDFERKWDTSTWLWLYLSVYMNLFYSRLNVRLKLYNTIPIQHMQAYRSPYCVPCDTLARKTKDYVYGIQIFKSTCNARSTFIWNQLLSILRYFIYKLKCLHYLYQNMSLEYYVWMGSVDISFSPIMFFFNHSTVYHYSILHTIRKSQTQIKLRTHKKQIISHIRIWAMGHLLWIFYGIYSLNNVSHGKNHFEPIKPIKSSHHWFRWQLRAIIWTRADLL